MKNTKKLSKSLRKHIRIEKARIRREFFDMKIQKEKIAKLYNPDKPIEKPKPKEKKPEKKKVEPKKNTSEKIKPKAEPKKIKKDKKQ